MTPPWALLEAWALPWTLTCCSEQSEHHTPTCSRATGSRDFGGRWAPHPSPSSHLPGMPGSCSRPPAAQERKQAALSTRPRPLPPSSRLRDAQLPSLVETSWSWFLPPGSTSFSTEADGGPSNSHAGHPLSGSLAGGCKARDSPTTATGRKRAATKSDPVQIWKG